VIYVEYEARRMVGAGPASSGTEGADGIRLILTITDPCTVHHGSLGFFARV
jgi:phosphonoacetate hydrolase